MSKQVTIEGFVYETSYFGSEKSYSLYSSDSMADKFMSLVGPAKFAYTIPDDYDPIPSQVAAIKKQQQELKAAFAKKMMELEDDLSKLLCIESAVTV